MNKSQSMMKTIAVGCLLSCLTSHSANAQFTYTGGNMNSTQTYDGAGVDSGLNPHTVTAGNMYLANGADGTLNMESGSLTFNVNDFTAGRGNGDTGIINANGGTLTINNNGQWGAAVTNGSGGNSTGRINVAAGATLDWTLSNTNAGEGFRIQNGNASKVIDGEVNMNGGLFNLTMNSGSATNQSFEVSRDGGTGSTGSLNLNSGTFNLFGATAFVLDTAGAGVGHINVDNGHLMTDSTTFTLGDGIIDYTSTGSGSISIAGFADTDFLAWATAGQLKIDGSAVSDLSGFTYSAADGQGVLSIIPEPSTYAMLFGLSVLVLVTVRRRKA